MSWETNSSSVSHCKFVSRNISKAKFYEKRERNKTLLLTTLSGHSNKAASNVVLLSHQFLWLPPKTTAKSPRVISCSISKSTQLQGLLRKESLNQETGKNYYVSKFVQPNIIIRPQRLPATEIILFPTWHKLVCHFPCSLVNVVTGSSTRLCTRIPRNIFWNTPTLPPSNTEPRDLGDSHCMSILEMISHVILIHSHG